MIHYVYILECGDKSLYTGYTNDLDRRLKMHQKNKGAKYTRGRGPFKIVHVEEFQDKSEAMKREYAIKQLTKRQKMLLIQKEKGSEVIDRKAKSKRRR